jgi:DNA polymerase-3 subunit epsilon
MSTINKRYVIADTETCGLRKMKIACEVALMEIDPETLEPIGTWASLIDPEIAIPEFVTGIHGITDEMVADQPTLTEFIEHKLHGGLEGEITFIAHNVPFDLPLLTGIGSITRSVCTLFEARQMYHNTPSHKLQDLRLHFGFPENEAHRALSDVHTTRRLLGQILKDSGRTLDQLADAKDRTVHVMPFGQHKGQLLMTVPRQYLSWLVQQENVEANLLASIHKVLKTK